MLHPSTRTRFRIITANLLPWHVKNQRSFIWRELRRSPYVVLVSEFMLQQTGVKQVEKKLPEFLRQFPSIKKLADAPRPQVVQAWHGLGYNRRALNLHAAAKSLAKKRQFPKTLEELRELPGVGLYTASAVLAFAYNEDTPVVDVNIERVLSRLWKRMKGPNDKIPIRNIYELDAEILPHGQSSAWHEALMDLGSTVCTKNSPKCGVCPIRQFCSSSKSVKGQVSIRSKNTEPRYFGAPRRIWRGRILQLVTLESRMTPLTISSTLKKKFKVMEVSFVPFVKSILKTLQKEGFIQHTRNGAVTLAHE